MMTKETGFIGFIRVFRHCSRLLSVLFGIGSVYGFCWSYTNIKYGFGRHYDSNWLDDLLNLVFMGAVPLIITILLVSLSIGFLRLAKKCRVLESDKTNESVETKQDRINRDVP